VLPSMQHTAVLPSMQQQQQLGPSVMQHLASAPAAPDRSLVVMPGMALSNGIS
jgi:hypothetical protein